MYIFVVQIYKSGLFEEVDKVQVENVFKLLATPILAHMKTYNHKRTYSATKILVVQKNISERKTYYINTLRIVSNVLRRYGYKSLFWMAMAHIVLAYLV